MPEWTRGDGYVVSTDPSCLDLARMHAFLRTAYWSPGIPRETLERAVRHSLPFGLLAPPGEQAGFARVVTDRATFAYLGDVYVEPEHRGRGLGVFLISCVLAHPDLQGLRRFILATADAHSLYARFGFKAPSRPDRLMTIDRSPEELGYSDSA